MFISFKQTPKVEAIREWGGRPGDQVVSEAGKQYVIQEKLGVGGFADVYLVSFKETQKFALKILRMWQVPEHERAEVRHRFDREYKCSQINSPYLVRTFDKGSHLGNPFFIMKYCPYGNLGDWVGQTISEKDYTFAAVRILKGLRDLHREGVIHRDLKPVNILLNENGEVLLTDFGISGYLQSRITIRDWLGHVKQIFGTVVYMPPEQLNAREAFLSLGPVTDMFAFGVMMHELICKGLLPYGAYDDKHESEFLNRLVAGRYSVFSSSRKHMPAVWANIIEGCIQPDPTKRIQSPMEVLKLLNVNDSSISEVFKPVKGHPVLRILKGEEHGKTYDLDQLRRRHKTNVLTMGWRDPDRPDDNHIKLEEKITRYVSHYHATLEFDAEEELWYIRDGQFRKVNKELSWVPSTNGILVNSFRVTDEGYALNVADIITLGDTTLRLDVQS